jgi:putative NADH-flavin reductase
VKHDKLTVVQGDVADLALVSQIVADQGAVLSALGNPTPMSRNPSLVIGIRNIVAAMQGSQARRLIYLSFLGVGEGREQLGGLLRYLAPVLLRNEIADHQAKETIVRNSGLDWTIVRPPKLTNGQWTGIYRHGLGIRSLGIIPTISRADVADFMLRQISDDTYLRQTPAVMG